MAQYIVNDTELTAVADAIRTKGGTSESISFPAGFVSAVSAFPEAIELNALTVTENGTYNPSSGHAFSTVSVSVPTGGGQDIEDAIVMGTISGSYTNNRVTKIERAKFMCCSSITAVNFQSCNLIRNSAFYSCSKLTTANFPACETIEESAFYACFSLTAISFPVCKTVGINAFNTCNMLSEANFSGCVSISQSAFKFCSGIITANFPACTNVAQNAFAYCYSLTTISFPVCLTVGSSAFDRCSCLTTVNFPSCKTFGSCVFSNCSALEVVSLPSISVIGSKTFMGCWLLLSLYLLGSSKATLYSRDVFDSTPIGGYTASTGGVVGSIYVRASLLTQWQSATNWTYYSSRMVGLTDAQIEALNS